MNKMSWCIVMIMEIATCHCFCNLLAMMPGAQTLRCTLDQLLRTWHQEHGMPAALTKAAPMICLHVDRLFEGPSGQIEKSSCAIDIESEVTIPVFCNATLACSNVGYVLIAAASHLGIDAGGHYQAILKIQPMVTQDSRPAKWLLTQDNMRPCPTWRIPEVIMQNLNIAWLVRSDCIQLPQYQPDLEHTDPAMDTTQQLLGIVELSYHAANGTIRCDCD